MPSGLCPHRRSVLSGLGAAAVFHPAPGSAADAAGTAPFPWRGRLVQGGLRDLWLLYVVKSAPAAAPRRRLPCMCLESSVGLTGVVVGVILALSGIGRPIALNPSRWMGLTAAVLILGFLAKDLVISWRPLGIRRDPEHHSIVFTWWS